MFTGYQKIHICVSNLLAHNSPCRSVELKAIFFANAYTGTSVA